MAVTAISKFQVSYPWNTANGIANKAWVDAMTDAMNTATTDGAGFLM